MAKEKCWRCNGSGKVYVDYGIYDCYENCPTCRGSGTIDEKTCTKCGGHGTIQTTFGNSNVPAQYETCPKCHGSGKSK